MTLPFRQNDLILFIGDSITDCRRDKEIPDTLGMGFAAMAAGRLSMKHPELNLRFLNRGINGHRTCDLLARWDADCISLQPDWVSILIGVNNTWRRYDSGDPTPDDVFESEYRRLLQRLKDETEARIIMCSPFLLHVDAFVQGMREDLDPKIAIIRSLAAEFGAVWVDFDAAFVAAVQRHIPSYWAEDGVHPSIAGHALMAETWLNAL
jgi:lysophospholipase L1-like esterase